MGATVAAVVHSILEIPDRASEALAKLRQLVGAEEGAAIEVRSNCRITDITVG